MDLSHAERNGKKITLGSIKQEVAAFLTRHDLEGDIEIHLLAKDNEFHAARLGQALETWVKSLADTLSTRKLAKARDPNPATRLNEILEIILPNERKREQAFTGLFEVARQAAQKSISL